MLTLPGLICFVAYILMRPSDLFASLRSIPFLYILFGVAVFGFVVDLSRRAIQWAPGPQMPWVIALVLWTFLTLLIRAPGTLGDQKPLLIAPALYFLVANGAVGFRSFSRLAGTFLVSMLAVAAVCVHQGLQRSQCVAWPEEEAPQDPKAPGVPDGRPCALVNDCYNEQAERDTRYQCEHVGIAGIQSVAGRVRYVGILEDPNEVALAASVGVPIAIARHQRRRSGSSLLVLCLTLVLVFTAVVMTQSRGGQLTFLTVLAVYFVSRHRWKGIIWGAVLAVPVLLYGGRSGSSADESTTTRLELQWEGIHMFASHPVLGVGHGQFTQYASHTAHNSYLLAPAELGFVGMVTWVMVLWTSIKAVRAGLKTSVQSEDSEGRAWGSALLATLLGLAAGILFLSFNYHYVLWTVFGLSAAYYQSVKQRHPELEMTISFKDVVLATAGNLAILAAMMVWIRIRGTG